MVVYGKNTNYDLGHTCLYFKVIRDSEIDITGEFWRKDSDWGYFLKEKEIVNKRVGPIREGYSYYIKARCEFRSAPIFTDCNGTFTISSWY
jgi:hypothetical protein